MVDAKTAETLEGLARRIEETANKAEEQVLQAAKLMREARRRVEAGEAGEVTWYSWASNHIKLSMSRLRELQRIAKAKDPAKELERQRKQTQKRVEACRQKKAAEKRGLEPERRDLIAWAKKAPIEEIRRILARIPSNNNAPGTGEDMAAANKPGADLEAA